MKFDLYSMSVDNWKTVSLLLVCINSRITTESGFKNERQLITSQNLH